MTSEVQYFSFSFNLFKGAIYASWVIVSTDGLYSRELLLSMLINKCILMDHPKTMNLIITAKHCVREIRPVARLMYKSNLTKRI